MTFSYLYVCRNVQKISVYGAVLCRSSVVQESGVHVHSVTSCHARWERSLWARGRERVKEGERVWGREGWGTEREREGVRLLHARIPHFIAGWTLLCDVCCCGAAVALCEDGVKTPPPPLFFPFTTNAGGLVIVLSINCHFKWFW